MPRAHASTGRAEGSRLRYLDANVFLFAALDEGARGEGARELLGHVVRGGEPAATSILTIDEVVWILLQEGPREVAIREGERLMSLPHLRILDVTGEAGYQALALMDQAPGLDPRDAIHAAVALQHGIYTIVSDDADLDEVPGLERRAIAGTSGTASAG